MLPQFELYTFFVDELFFQVKIYNTSIFTIRTIPCSSFEQFFLLLDLFLEYDVRQRGN